MVGLPPFGNDRLGNRWQRLLGRLSATTGCKPAPLASGDDTRLPDPITVEVMSLCPRFREDLRLTKQIHSGQVSFLIEDPVSGRFSRIGVPEFTLVSLLDGTTTVAEALAITASKHGVYSLDESDAISLCGWLVESGLAQTAASRTSGRISALNTKRSDQRIAGLMNPMFQKLPLMNPSSLVNPLVQFIQLALHRGGVLPLLFCGVIAWVVTTIVLVLSNGDRFWQSSGDVLSSHNWIWLALTWLIVKGVHELGHAVACRSLEGAVGQAGLMMVLFVPMPYVDVSSSLAFQNKWHRMLVAAAGMMVELVLASLAFALWVSTDSSLVQMHARNLIVTATLTTVLFNLNPLMRFDGYYLLSDFLELPNLATNASRWWNYVCSKYLLGSRVVRPTWPEGKRPFVAAYAMGAFLWRILICVSLAIAAMSLFWGAGIVLTVIAVLLWVGKPVLRFLSNKNSPMRIGRRALLIRSGGVGAAILVVLMIPFRRTVTAPVVVAYDEPTEVRANVRGFVDQVMVEQGQMVRTGDVLVRMCDQQLEMNQARLAIEIVQSEQRQRVLRNQRSLVELEIEQANETALLTRQADIEQRLRDLVIVADTDGQIVHSDLVDAEGTVVTAGHRLFVIANSQQLKWVAMIDQQDAVAIRERDAFSASVWLHGVGVLPETLNFTDLKPRATCDLVHPALASVSGGPLDVYRNPQARSNQGKWKLTTPRVVAEAKGQTKTSARRSEDADQGQMSHSLRSGQTGIVKFSLGRQTIGAIVLDQLQQWYQEIDKNSRVALR